MSVRNSKEQQLYDSSCDNEVLEVIRILESSAKVDVNWNNENEHGWTPLHIACVNGHSLIVSLLLSHPAVKVNHLDYFGNTPFLLSCLNGKHGVVKILLDDPRTLVNLHDGGKFTALRWAAYQGHIAIVQLLIASGRQLNMGTPGNYQNDAIGQAILQQNHQVAELLTEFKNDRLKTTNRVRHLLGFKVDLSAELFALLVFHSDDYLRLRETAELQQPAPGVAAARRLLVMARQFPMELQMVLCHRMCGSGRNNVTKRESELAFRALVREILMAPAD